VLHAKLVRLSVLRKSPCLVCVVSASPCVQCQGASNWRVAPSVSQHTFLNV
jgi:hypothetical protein